MLAADGCPPLIRRGFLRRHGLRRGIFPNAACVVSLVDRLIHNAEIIAIEGESYRLKEARERSEQRARQRNGAKR